MDINSQGRRSRRIVTTVLLAVAAVLGAAPGASAAGRSCPDAGLVPTRPDQLHRLQRATRCLVNRERVRHHLKALRLNGELEKSALWQGDDMLQHQYFDHSRPDGPDFVERILRFGYASTADGYMLGENLAWASSPIATPRKMVRMWMNSPPHRRNILTRAFHEQAIGAVWSGGGVGGAYADSGGPFVIFVNQFGRRY
jgi:uncharacterized protein YkwD